MPATIKKNLYLAKNITELNTMTEVPASKAGANCRMLMSTAGKMFESAEEAYLVGDEERAYVLFMKYLNVISIIRKSADFKKDSKYYTNMMAPKNSMKALEKAEELSEKLKFRYSEKEAEEVSKKLESLNASGADNDSVEAENLDKAENSLKDETVKSGTKNENKEESIKEKGPIDPSAPPGGVTVPAVYRLLNDVGVSVVLMDVRTSEEFEKSHIRDKTCINVPADIVPPGTTVSHIGRKLPTGSSELWNSRSGIDYIILFDWRCSASSLQPRSALQSLKDALYKWDVETTLKNEPLIMEGGYEQWLLCYPAFSTNANVKCPLPDTSPSSAAPSLDSFDYDVDLEFLQPPKPPPPPPVEEKTSDSNGESLSSTEVNNGNTSVSMPQQSTNIPAGIPKFDRTTKPKTGSDKAPPSTTVISDAAIPTVFRTSSSAAVSMDRNKINNGSGMNNEAKGQAPSLVIGQQRGISRINNQLGNTTDLSRSISSDRGNTVAAESSDKKVNTVAPPAVRRDTKPAPRANQNVIGRKNTTELEDSSSDTANDGDTSGGSSVDLTQKGDRKKESKSNKTKEKNNRDESVELDESESWELNSVRELKASETRKVADLMRMKKRLEDDMKVLRQQQKQERESTKNADVSKLPETSETTVSNQNASEVGETGKDLQATASNSTEENKKQQIEPDEQRKSTEAKKKALEEEEAKRKAEDRRLEEEIKKMEQERQKLEQETERQAAIEHDKEQARKREFSAAKEREAVLEQARQRELKAAKEAAIEQARQRELSAAKEKEVKEGLRRKLEEEEKSRRAAKIDDGTPENLPAGWVKMWDESTRKYFYVNHNTKKTQWNPPALHASPSDGSVMYKKRLRDDEGKEGGGSNLKRSHSFHNISSSEEKSPHGRLNSSNSGNAFFSQPPPSVDRQHKPSPTSSKVVLSANVAAAKVRNLQPTYGSTGKGLTGLRNLGNTCYMNSIVQCLSNTAPLTIYFLSDCYLEHLNRNARSASQGEVAEEFGALVKALWSNQYRAVSPRDLRGAVCKLDSMFATSQHQDAQELLEYLMHGLNEDLNQVKVKPVLKEQNNDNIPDVKAAQMIWEQSLQFERSIIVDLFRGQYKSTVTCLKCDKKSVVFEQFMCLTLPIPSTTYCNLTDCLAHFCKEEKMTGDSKWFCPRCACKRDATKRIVIWRLPPILLVHLKRFYYQGIWRDKITTNIDFPLRNFDMSKCIAGPDTRQPYTLYAVTNHFGTLDGGHYTAYCRNLEDGDWYKFDDQDVYRMPESNVQSSAAYMLFYSSMKLDYGRI